MVSQEQGGIAWKTALRIQQLLEPAFSLGASSGIHRIADPRLFSFYPQNHTRCSLTIACSLTCKDTSDHAQACLPSTSCTKQGYGLWSGSSPWGALAGPASHHHQVSMSPLLLSSQALGVQVQSTQLDACYTTNHGCDVGSCWLKPTCHDCEPAEWDVMQLLRDSDGFLTPGGR